MSEGKSAVILGATGQTGRYVLRNLLASSEFTRVAEYGRRVTPADQITVGKEKLEQKVINFEKIEESGLKDGKWDVVYITLGTTKAAAGSEAAFEKIDRDYVLHAAKEARNPEKASQRIVYCSVAGADSKSKFLYNRCKGETEEGLSSLGYADTIFFRPGFLAGAKRDENNVLVSLAGKVTGFLSKFTDSIEINVETLGRSIFLAGKLGSQNLPVDVTTAQIGGSETKCTLVNNSTAMKLAETKE